MKCEMGGSSSTYGEVRNVHKIVVGKLDGNRQLGRPRCRWEDKIRMKLREIVWYGVDWIHLGQDRGQWRVPVNTVLNLRVP
jgi:hypothetical protein